MTIRYVWCLNCGHRTDSWTNDPNFTFGRVHCQHCRQYTPDDPGLMPVVPDAARR